MATFFSTTEAATVAIRFSTSEGAKFSVMVNFRVEGSGAVISVLTLSLFQPSWVNRKAGVLSRMTTRWSEKAMSSAVTVAPLSNFWFGRNLNV